MKELKEIRKAIGVTQHAFAEILGVSRSLIAMVEKDDRKLPTNALIKLGQLQVSIVTNPPDAAMGPAEIAPSELEAIEIRLQEILSRRQELLAKAQKKLQSIEAAHSSAGQALKVIQQEREVFSGIPTYLKKLDERMRSVAEICHRTHPDAQRMARMRVAELQALVGVTTAEINRGSLQITNNE